MQPDQRPTISPELEAFTARQRIARSDQDLSPELQALIACTPVANTYDDLSPELRAFIEGRPLPTGEHSGAGLDDDIFAFIEGRRPIPRGYRGRRVAVLRGIGPHNLVIYLVTWITVFGGCFIFSLFYNLLFTR
jgi:hypothetical protein